MNKLPTALVLLLQAGLVQAQPFSLTDLLGFTQCSAQKLEVQLRKKDFKKTPSPFGGSSAPFHFIQAKSTDKENLFRKISFANGNNPSNICYQTSSLSEFARIKKDMAKAGFHCYEGDGSDTVPRLYQRGASTIYTFVEKKDSISFYSFSIDRGFLPKPKDVAYAEDLLQFSSHEALASFFGSANVKKDVFHYTEKEVNKCTVLFPNTSREVIFIWHDEVNFRKPAFLIIGGEVQTQGTALFTRETLEYTWRSRQGIHFGMSLQELQSLNRGPVKFYSWDTDRPGMLVPPKEGEIDFSQMSLVFGCLNCPGGNKKTVSKIINSENALADDQKIYISTLIILPEKRGATLAARQ